MKVVIRGKTGGAIALSIISNIFLYVGLPLIIIGLFNGEWEMVIPGSVFLVIGIILGFLGIVIDTTPEERKFNDYLKWQKRMEKDGWTKELLQGSMQKSIEYYRLRPERNTFYYVTSCNKQASQYIQMNLLRRPQTQEIYKIEMDLFNEWLKKMAIQGWTKDVISKSVDKSLQFYNFRPEYITLQYIKSVNPQAAQHIENRLGQKSNKS